jgi:hypothetical protein
MRLMVAVKRNIWYFEQIDDKILHMMDDNISSDVNAGAQNYFRQLRLFWLIPILLIVAFGVYHAYSLRYVNDDAFISFRYAKNLVEGKGLVYNAGERVEAYTNFLWTLLMALGMLISIDPVTFSIILGIACYAILLLLYGLAGNKYRSPQLFWLYAFPLTAVGLSIHRDFNVYATSGLETSMYTLLVSATFLTLLNGTSASSRFSAGFMICFAMMTRPDGVIFLMSSLIYLMLFRENGLKNSFAFLLPVLALFLPYWIWRWTYFGMFFPNSFYAKSIDLPYYSQGLSYLWVYIKTYYVFAALVPLGLMVGVTMGTFHLMKPVRGWLFTNSPKPLLLSALFILPYAAFVVRIGGDFMFARFFIPITPQIYFMLESLCERIGSKAWTAAWYAIIILATSLRWDQFTDLNYIPKSGITDEHQVYTEDHLWKARADGERLKRYFAGYHVRVIFLGTMSRLVYYADIPYAIEGTTGLTDPYIAHMNLSERGRPGHEKTAPWKYIISKNVNFLFKTFRQVDTTATDYINLGGFPAQILIYDNALMEHLATFPEITFSRLQDYLDFYIANMSQLSREDVAKDYAAYKEFYFDHQRDSQREQAFIDYLKDHK